LCVDGLLKENKMDEITTEQIAQNYTAMGHSVQLITDVIAGDAMADEEAEERQGCVDRNVEHLELMVAKDYWTDENMTAVNAAITAGKGYTAS
jgi:GTPase Era involved in 16S rRNA processing